MKYKKFLYALPLIISLLYISCKSTPVVPDTEEEEPQFSIELPPEDADTPISEFREIWAYVVADREFALKPNLPLTDIGYFSADINIYGELVDIPDRRKLPAFSGRVHLIVKCDGRALTHFVLVPGSSERKALVNGLINASKNYDGLQIDFENVPLQDGESFLGFLRELRTGLGSKMFTIALPARTKKIANDVYDYEKILPLVDRILIMAYDEHWSTSGPGPVASLSWCKKVADYSLKTIGREKLIMGLPFYGRAWGNPNPSQAYIYTGIERVINENNVTDIKREEGIPAFNYTIPVLVKVYYDDLYSLSARMEMYRSMGAASIGFWRLGQETPVIWDYIKISE